MGEPIDIEPGWVDGQVRAYAERRDGYVAHAELLRAVLAWLAGPVCPTAVVAARAKAVSSFAGKIIKRVQLAGRMPVTGKMQYELTPDLSAGKVVTHLQRQVAELEPLLERVLERSQRRFAESELAADQFGYRAVHVWGKLRVDQLDRLGFFCSPGGRPFAGRDLSPMTAIVCEVQLVTLAQYLWESFTHDRQYKSDFVLPRVWSRQAYRIAAALESIDEAFEEIVDGLSMLETNVGRYLNPTEVSAEAERMAAIVRWAPDDEKLVARLARTRTLLGEYDRVITLLDDGRPLSPRLKSELGYALCCRDRTNRSDVDRGVDLLMASAAARPDVETLTRLADLSPVGEVDKRELWRNAYLARPTDPTALGGFLRHEMASTHDGGISQLLHPNIAAGRRTLSQQIELRINLPNALYLLAEFDLMQGQPYPALYRLCRALALTPSGRHGSDLLDDVAAALGRLRAVRPEPVGLQWCLWTVEIARAVRAAGDGPVALPEPLQAAAGHPIGGPVVILAGGCDAAADVHWPDYAVTIDFALTDFAGTLISGGTRSGIGDLAGDLIARRPDARRGLCWLPPHLPAGTVVDGRYQDCRTAPPTADPPGFSPAEPLRAWLTILRSGIRPADVKLVGVNGGPIATFEYHLAAVLGAQVGVIRSSGRAADQLGVEQDEPGNQAIRFLPADRETLRAFVEHPARSGFTDAEVKTLAEQADAAYHALSHEQTRAAWDAKLAAHPSLARTFSLSNVDQVEHIRAKLARVGLRLTRSAADGSVGEFTPEQVELLAEMEHGRWVTERTLAGWKLGPADDANKRRPQLVGWSDAALTESEKEKDRAAVRAIPRMLAAAGCRIERSDRAGG